MAIETIELEEEEMEEEEEDEEEEMPTSYTTWTHSNDETVNRYLQSIALIPLLTAEEEKILTWKIWRSQKKIAGLEEQVKNEGPTVLQELEMAIADYQKLRNQLWEHNLRLIIGIAYKYWQKVRDKMDFSDLIQEGNIGLKRAIEKFDPRKGNKFSTYAVLWIRQGIRRAITNIATPIRLPAHIISGFGDVKKAMKKIKEKDEIINLDSLVESLKENYSEDQVRRILGAQKLINPISLDAPLFPEQEEKGKAFGDFVQDSKPSPEEKALNNVALEEIRAVLEQLNEKERLVLTLRFGLDNGPERTLQGIGDVLGISREGVRQIQEIALKKLGRPDRARRLKKLEIEDILEE